MRVSLQFVDLSTDIKTLIISHILRPTDLVSLCLTSKQLHEISVRYLYREICLDIGSPRDLHLAPFINPGNIGLQYVRKLDLYLAEVLDKCGQLDQAHLAVRMILEFLPENILERFSWHPWQPFSAANLELLYRRQRKLKNLEGIALNENAWERLDKIPRVDELFSNVQKLHFFPDNRDVVTFCGELLKRVKGVEELNVHTSFCEESEHQHYINPRDLHDTATEPGLLTRTLFSHMMPFTSCTPMTLRKLELQKINLRFCADTYARIFDFPKLQELSVQRCPGVEAFLSEICKSSKLPEKLRELCIKHKDNDTRDGMSALDGFLCLVTGLEELTIDFSNADALPQAAGIVHHSKTLTTLVVHAADEWNTTADELVYDAGDFKKLCEECSRLEELSMATPDRLVNELAPAEFDAWLAPLGKLARLHTLHLSVWPINTPGAAMTPRSMYTQMLQLHAARLFGGALLTNPKLRIVAFGTSDKTFDRRDSANLVIFARGIAPRIVGNSRKVKGGAGDGGETKVYAQEVGWNDRRYIEAKSEVLDLDLGCNRVKMPVKGEWEDDL